MEWVVSRKNWSRVWVGKDFHYFFLDVPMDFLRWMKVEVALWRVPSAGWIPFRPTSLSPFLHIPLKTDRLRDLDKLASTFYAVIAKKGMVDPSGEVEQKETVKKNWHWLLALVQYLKGRGSVRAEGWEKIIRISRKFKEIKVLEISDIFYFTIHGGYGEEF